MIREAVSSMVVLNVDDSDLIAILRGNNDEPPSPGEANGEFASSVAVQRVQT